MNRIEIIKGQVKSNALSNKQEDSVTITDNRTGTNKYKLMKIKLTFFNYSYLGKTYTFKLFDGALKASDLETIRDANKKPLRSYDPAYMNTINCVRNNPKY